MKMPIGIEDSISCFNDEDLVNKAYEGLIATMDLVKPYKMTKNIEILTQNGNRKKDYNVFAPLLDGIYIPGSIRNYWTGFVDPIDYPLPEIGCVYISPRFDNVNFEFITIKKIKKLPYKVTSSCKKPKDIFKIFNVFLFKNTLRVPFVEESYYCIDQDGAMHTTLDRLKLRHIDTSKYYLQDSIQRENINGRHYAAGAISLLADRRYLWNIKTIEHICHGMDAIVNFGVEKEMVKSLVFARDNPLTDTGRKRPILHWVQSHLRRIRKGIDVNIKKHLRGISKFNIGELTFEITKPVKNIK